MSDGPRILIVGEGYGGMHTALRLVALLFPREVVSLDVLERTRQDFSPAARDRGFPWRLALLLGMLRWAGPGRRAYLLVLAVLATALLRLVAVAGRLLMTLAEGAVLTEPTALKALGDARWAGWEPGQASRHSASSVQDRPRPDETGLR